MVMCFIIENFGLNISAGYCQISALHELFQSSAFLWKIFSLAGCEHVCVYVKKKINLELDDQLKITHIPGKESLQEKVHHPILCLEESKCFIKNVKITVNYYFLKTVSL